MKRIAIVALVTVAVCLLSGCPPQKPSDICPGFAHCAVLTWKGPADTVLRGPDCNSLQPLGAVSQTATAYVDTSVTPGQSYCYAVSGAGGSSNTYPTAIP